MRNVIIETDNELFADLIFRGNRPGAYFVKDYDRGVCRVSHISRLIILAEWARQANVGWDGIEDIVIAGMIARCTPHKLIVTEPPPLSGKPKVGE